MHDVRGSIVKGPDGRRHFVTLDDEAWLALGLLPGQRVIVVQDDGLIPGEVVTDPKTGARMVFVYVHLRGDYVLVRRPR